MRRPMSWGRGVMWGAALLVLLPQAAQAQVAASCGISTTGVAFGNYDPTQTATVFANGTVSVDCTYLLEGFSISITLATGNSGTYASRSMVSGSQVLAYNLYVNSADTEVFGNGSGGTYYFQACYIGLLYLCPGGGYFSGTTVTKTVYGVLPAGQDVAAGVYADTMVLTVTF